MTASWRRSISMTATPSTVAYMVRAVTPGTFTMPGVVAEDMYRADTFARTSSTTITVAKR